MDMSKLRTGGQLLLDALVTNNADIAFGVPGESYLAVLDALYETPTLNFVVCRQEGGAAMMAEAYGKLTGRPGICFVTRGPGATNASAGVHVAFQDSTPLILFIGQVGKSMIDREAFQEIDYRRMFGQMSKWVAQIDEPARVPEYVNRAFFTAMSGRPGPVILALPEDMLTEKAFPTKFQPAQKVQAYPNITDIRKFFALLKNAKKPIVILGGNNWSDKICRDFQRFAEKANLPVACAFRYQHLFDNKHNLYVGDVGIGINPNLAKTIRESDLIVALGARLGEITTGGYSLISCPIPKQELVHIYPGPEELGKVYQPTLAINASPTAFVSSVKNFKTIPAIKSKNVAQARNQYLNWSSKLKQSSGVNLGKIVIWLSENTPPNTIITNGAGNYSAWVHRYYKYRGFGTGLAPTSGSMGYGTPAALSAKLLFPKRLVIAFAGDGCFLMTGQELATAVHHKLPIIIIVANNGMYGTIRMHQERQYPNRVFGTNIINPDFAALARAYGAIGETVEKDEEFPDIFENIRKAQSPALIELKTSPEAITPNKTLTEIINS